MRLVLLLAWLTLLPTRVPLPVNSQRRDMIFLGNSGMNPGPARKAGFIRERPLWVKAWPRHNDAKLTPIFPLPGLEQLDETTSFSDFPGPHGRHPGPGRRRGWSGTAARSRSEETTS